MMDRRALLVAAATGAALAPGLTRAAVIAPSRPNETPSPDALRAFMRMASTLNGKSFSTVEGAIHGAAPGETARPLVGFHSLVEIHVAEPQPGIFRTEQREATWFTDLATGAIATEFVNPYTGVSVVPFGYVSPTNVYWFDKTGVYQRELPAERTGTIAHEWMTGGTTLWVSEARRNVFPSGIDEAEFPKAYNGTTRVSTDVLSYQARRSDFDRRTPSVPATIHMTTNGPWPFWLMMGRRAGGVIWIGHGEKYASMAAVPEPIRAGCESVYPGFVADPFKFPEREYGTAATMRRLRAAGKI